MKVQLSANGYRLPALALLLLACLLASAPGLAQTLVRPDAQAGLEAEVRNAILAAVESRMGAGVDVQIESLVDIRVAPHDGPLLAVPDQTAREGRPSRFTISAPGRSAGGIRIGEATAVVRMTADVVRASHALARSAIVQLSDIEAARMSLDGAAFAPIPPPEFVIGSRTTRAIAAGAVVTRLDINPEPAVRNGDQVRVLLRMPGVEVTSTAVAIQTGIRDEVIRVVNPESKRSMRARVTGIKEVEVIHEP